MSVPFAQFSPVIVAIFWVRFAVRLPLSKPRKLTFGAVKSNAPTGE